MRFVAGKVVVLAALFVGAVALVAGQGPQGPGGRAGGGGGGQAPQNLKVLPTDWSGAQVRQLMQTFVESLGVSPPTGEGCGHCHAVDRNAPPPQEGRGPSLDWASDEKPEKEVARKMIQMTLALNSDALSGIGDAAVKEKVSCWSCHQGNKTPAMTPASGWGRGNFTLIPPGPTVPQRGAGGGGRGN
jgi:cytochrome c551/c552